MMWANPYKGRVLPVVRVPIMMLCESGYIAPNDLMLISGFYDPEFRPRSPWLDAQGSCLTDAGLIPVLWVYLTDFISDKLRADVLEGKFHNE